MGRKGGITGDGVGEQLEREKGRRVRDARKEEAKLGRKKTVRREAGSGGNQRRRARDWEESVVGTKSSGNNKGRGILLRKSEGKAEES